VTHAAVLIPEVYANLLIGSGRNSGTLDLKCDRGEGLALVDGVRDGAYGSGRRGLSRTPREHRLAACSTNPGMGLWFRVQPRLHISGAYAAQTSLVITLDGFRADVVGGDWINPARDAYTLAITVAVKHDGTPFESDDDGLPGYLPIIAWRLDSSRGTAEMLPTIVVPEDADPLAALGDAWPLAALAGKTVALIGVGSIGSAAAEALVGYGVRRLALIDPDRLYFHNLARHRATAEHVGRHKVDAMADILRARDPRVDVEPLRLDVIYDADYVRPVLNEVGAVLVSSDGVDSRRAADHLTRRAGKPAVFACVLVDGAFGEILRIRPPRTGCLSCARAHMIAEDIIDPEPALDRGYGEGTRHLPMTAVRSDLALVGATAAKATIATLLERSGHYEQRLPGDHLIMGLRPKPGVAAPFDLEQAGAQHWRTLPTPRPGCPTCGDLDALAAATPQAA
jgi:molybdopterin/thiamine biosynthesis adenylyltransferase